MLSSCEAIGSDAKVGWENLGSFWDNEPNLEHVLRLFEDSFYNLVGLFAGGIGWRVGLMLRNRTGGTLRREDAMEGRLPVQHGAHE